MDWKTFWEVAWNWVLTTVGHAVTGAGSAALYELTQLAAAGSYNLEGLAIGVLLGGSIGFFKSVVASLESLKKEQGFAVGKPKKSYFY